MPLVGCGNGELDWPTQVRPIVEKYMKNLPIHVFVYSRVTNHVEIPEHRNIAAMEAWLRSEPENLPFSEVWSDLLDLLEKQEDFHTLATKTSTFKACASEDPQGISIESGGNKRFIDFSDLFDFWQQLTSYGFSSRQIAPSGLSRKSSYLMPIFAKLSYVNLARTSESFERLQNGSETIGLQYSPNSPLFKRESHRFSLAR